MALWTTSLDDTLARFADEIEDVDQEVFDLFSQQNASTSAARQDLGMLDPKAESLEVSVGGRDFVVRQSPGLLHSKLAGGTTGAAVWQTAVRFADWIGRSNVLVGGERGGGDGTRSGGGLVDGSSVVLELGAGSSGVLPTVLGERVAKYVATDQAYALKLLRENVDANRSAPTHISGSSKRQRAPATGGDETGIGVGALDWETDDAASVLRAHGLTDGVDMIVSCDCVYNYALIEPFVQVCVDACQLRASNDADVPPRLKPTVCVVAQHLRQPDVFEEWLAAFAARFRVWRIRDELLNDDLKEGSGFVVHLGVLR